MLVRGVVERLVEQDFAFWSGFDGAAPEPGFDGAAPERGNDGAAPEPGFDGAVPEPGCDAVLARIAAYVRWSVTDGRVRSVARLNLFAAAAVEPELREPLRRGRAEVERMGASIGAAIGLGEVASALVMDVCDALISRQLAMPDDAFDPQPALTSLLSALLPTDGNDSNTVNEEWRRS
ncbi:hypothetical protein [Tsukamurella sp. PLM1]|uniref:hypothetical protein n=1 Tax=Tsukamurella sp. PLM1 TaxID=2929795 RepID=UPI00206AB681|nr:hypothetical protein [Tsukamurella sp. PLM1]BDH58862.1 hypothetical protein MTP03_38010 [Tsukamurella sp. PLM1]